MDSTAALELADIPERLLVIGGGYIGLELGQVYAALGSAVTVVEMTDGLLPGVDRALVQPLARRCEKLFNKIRLGTKVTSLTEKGSAIEARFDGDDGVFDRVLVAVGRRPASAGLGLENTRVNPDARSFITVDDRCRTSDRAIYAVGDVTGEPMLAHRAMRQGKVAAEVIAGRPSAFDNVVVPAVVFTDPEVAWCGLTEFEAARAGRSVRVAKREWAAAGRAPDARTHRRPDEAHRRSRLGPRPRRRDRRAGRRRAHRRGCARRRGGAHRRRSRGDDPRPPHPLGDAHGSGRVTPAAGRLRAAYRTTFTPSEKLGRARRTRRCRSYG